MNTARTTSAIAAAVIVGTTLTGCSPSSQPEELRLKNHKGESVSRAVAGMEEAGLDRAYIAARDARSINDEAKGHWTVCRQDPKAGTRITGPVGFEVTLYAVPDGSKCPDYVPTGVMPDVVDMRWKKAKLPLRQAGVNLDMVTLKPMGYGLSSQVTEEDEGSGYDDWVICEQNPDEGDGVNSNTPVELDISEEDSCTAQEEKEEEEERRKKREAAKAAKKKAAEAARKREEERRRDQQQQEYGSSSGSSTGGSSSGGWGGDNPADGPNDDQHSGGGGCPPGGCNNPCPPGGCTS